MGSLWERLDCEGGEPRLRSSGEPTIADALRSIEVARTPEATGLSPEDWLAVLAYAALGGPDELGPPLVQRSSPRPSIQSSLSEQVLANAFPRANRGSRLALQAGLLQIHDFWGPSHEAAQEADDLGESRFSAYWHGIAHRREPDAGNSMYWFRRVGRHPLFEVLGAAARPIVEEAGEDALAGKLIPSGGWNPSAMIELCVRAPSGSPLERVARRLQRLEMLLLLDASAAAI